jgi:hypothetical protein
MNGGNQGILNDPRRDGIRLSAGQRSGTGGAKVDRAPVHFDQQHGPLVI